MMHQIVDNCKSESSWYKEYSGGWNNNTETVRISLNDRIKTYSIYGGNTALCQSVYNDLMVNALMFTVKIVMELLRVS